MLTVLQLECSIFNFLILKLVQAHTKVRVMNNIRELKQKQHNPSLLKTKMKKMRLNYQLLTRKIMAHEAGLNPNVKLRFYSKLF